MIKSKVDWKTYAVHDANMVKGFFGDFRFLSNFEACCFIHEGVMYRSVENAYQAAKTEDEALRTRIAAMTPFEAKSWSHTITVFDDWHAKKRDIMYHLIWLKFQDPVLAAKLAATKSAYLEETNHWHDTYWGVDYQTGLGENMLGRILMEVRETLRFDRREEPVTS